MPRQRFDFDNWINRNINFLQEKWYQYISKDIRENRYNKPGIDHFELTSNKIQLTDEMSVRFYAELKPHPYIYKLKVTHPERGVYYINKMMYYYDIKCDYALTRTDKGLDIVSPRYQLPSNNQDNSYQVDPDSPTRVAPDSAAQYYPYDTTVPARDGIENTGASPHSGYIHHHDPTVVMGDIYNGSHV